MFTVSPDTMSAVLLLCIYFGVFLFFIRIHPIKALGQAILLFTINAGVVLLIRAYELNGMIIAQWVRPVLYLSSFSVDFYITQDAIADKYDPYLISRMIWLATLISILSVVLLIIMSYLLISITLPKS